MALTKKFSTCFITFLLLVSTFSILIIPDTALAEENAFEFDIDEILETLSLFKELIPDIIYPHPYNFLAEYYYDGDESVDINGDLVFDLYFTSNILTQTELFNDRDSIDISVYKIKNSILSDKITATKLENANVTKTLEPELFGENIQKCTVKMENIEHKLNVGDLLIFSIQINSSKKRISEQIEKRYERKIKAKIVKIESFLNESDNPDLVELGNLIRELLDILDKFGISSKEIADLSNSLISSSFVYDSNIYPSSVYIPINSDENITLYFHRTLSDNFAAIQFGQIKTANENKTTFDNETQWPPSPADPEEFMTWVYIWAISILSQEGFGDNENNIKYYLTSDNKLDPNGPEADRTAKKLSTSPIVWKSLAIDRNKIMKSAVAELYAYYPKVLILRKVTLNATLYDGDEALDTVEKQLNRTKSLELLQGGPTDAAIFKFEIPENYEIWNGNELSIELSVKDEPLLQLRNSKLVCGVEYPSNVYIEFEETKNINMTFEGTDSNQMIVPGDSAEFVVNITSKYEDTVELEVLYENNSDWTIDVPEPIDLEEGGYALAHIYVNSTDDTIKAEDDIILFDIVAKGKTGIDLKEGSVKVDKEAVDYIIDIKADITKQEVKHGEKCVYKFTVKNNNTGVWPDEYFINISSEHDWDLKTEILYDGEIYSIDELKSTDIDVGKEFIINVTLTVPYYTDISSDKLFLSVRSRSSSDDKITETIEVTTTVITPNILEQFYHFFESVADDIGLNDAIGDMAAPLLMFLVLFLIFMILLLIIIIIKKKYVEVICLERIKEINPDEQAIFEITIKNPTKNQKTYEIQIEKDQASEGFDIGLELENIVVESKESKVINLVVKPNDLVKEDDWTELGVIVNVADRKKSSKISTVVTIKDGKKDLKIYGVFHWPRVFKKGQKVETSFKLENKGNVSANNVTIVLYVNGKEKNKIEDITIPRGGYADLEIPWIAVKGKNDVDIVVK